MSPTDFSCSCYCCSFALLHSFATLRSGNPNRGLSQTIIFVALLLLTIDVLSLPTAIWGHVLAVKYQQSIQGWGSWLVDWAKGEAWKSRLA